MNTISIALFGDRAQAEPIRQRLAHAGLAAEIHEESALQKLWFVSKRAAGVSLEVPADQFVKAEALVATWDTADGALSQAIRCPECKSLRVDYPQFARNSVLTNLAAGLAAELGLVERDYFCQECHYTWPKERTTPLRIRPHMAPDYFIEDVAQTVSPRIPQPKSETAINPRPN
jgi:predicted Zn-ribbon and HTH transcriptional regulator